LDLAIFVVSMIASPMILLVVSWTLYKLKFRVNLIFASILGIYAIISVTKIIVKLLGETPSLNIMGTVVTTVGVALIDICMYFVVV
jgi:hypothetical protein